MACTARRARAWLLVAVEEKIPGGQLGAQPTVARCTRDMTRSSLHAR